MAGNARFLVGLTVAGAAGGLVTVGVQGGLGVAEAATSGTPRAAVEGVVVFDGESPAASLIDMSADPYCAGAHQTPAAAPRVAVGEAGGLAHVLVVIRSGPATIGDPTTGAEVVLNQQGCLYEPRVLAIRTGQTLVIRNSDQTLHNVHAHAEANRSFNVGQPMRGMESERTFAEPELIRVSCDIHGWMEAWVAVTEHSGFAVTDANGRFELPDLAPGDYVIEAWHPTLGSVTTDVTVADGDAARLEVTFGG